MSIALQSRSTPVPTILQCQGATAQQCAVAMAHPDAVNLAEKSLPALLLLQIGVSRVFGCGREQISLLDRGSEPDAIEVDADEANRSSASLHRATQFESGLDDGRIECGGWGQRDASTIASVIAVNQLKCQSSRFQTSLAQVPGDAFSEVLDHRVESARTGDVLVKGGSPLDATGDLTAADETVILASAAFVEDLAVSSQQSR